MSDKLDIEWTFDSFYNPVLKIGDLKLANIMNGWEPGTYNVWFLNEVRRVSGYSSFTDIEKAKTYCEAHVLGTIDLIQKSLVHFVEEKYNGQEENTTTSEGGSSDAEDVGQEGVIASDGRGN